jgi:hypothetical protein
LNFSLPAPRFPHAFVPLVDTHLQSRTLDRLRQAWLDGILRWIAVVDELLAGSSRDELRQFDVRNAGIFHRI